MTNNQMLAVEAVKRCIDSLANSDFVVRCGDLAIKELRSYKEDIALDIAAVYDGRPASNDERNAVVGAFS